MRYRSGFIVDRQHMVIAIAEYDREISRDPDSADFDAADVKKVPEVRIRREVEQKIPEAWLCEEVGNAAPGEGPTLLLHQLFKRAPGVAVLGTGDKADFAI